MVEFRPPADRALQNRAQRLGVGAEMPGELGAEQPRREPAKASADGASRVELVKLTRASAQALLIENEAIGFLRDSGVCLILDQLRLGGLFGILVIELRIKEFRPLATDRQRQIVLDGVETDVVPEDVAMERLKKGVAAAFEAFEETHPAKPHETFPGLGKVGDDSLFIRSRPVCGRGLEIVL